MAARSAEAMNTDQPAEGSSMEIDDNSVLNTTLSSSKTRIYLHPLVAMVISDHVTRFKLLNKEPSDALGILMGRQVGREVEISYCYDVRYDVIDNNWILNREFTNLKIGETAEVYPNIEVVGWYCLGSQPLARHLSMHAQITPINESPILLMFDPNGVGSEGVVIKTYETLVDLSNNQSREVFAEVPYTLRTTEAESIGVDHAAGAVSSGVSSVCDFLGSHEVALSMLNGRIKVIRDYVTAIKEGTLQPKEDILLAIGSLLATLKLSKEHEKEFNHFQNEELSDALMTATLATLTQGTILNEDVANKSNILYTSNNKKIKNMDLNMRIKPI